MNFTSKSEVEGLTKLAEGGEAVIYVLDRDSVLKIFHPKVDLSRKEMKVKQFTAIKNKMPDNVVCPQEEVTIRQAFAGYKMKKLKNAENIHMLVKPKFLMAEGFSNRDVLQIVTILGKTLNELHSMGILVGDISDYNFQICGKDVFCIDVDSWGIGRMAPDAYTELFTGPDSYNRNGSIDFSVENENYNFALLAFFLLTHIHPFGGTYKPNPDLTIIERMKKRISVVGKKKGDIVIPKIIGSWKWMSPKLENDFIDIFDEGKKIDITPDLEDLLKNLKYCDKHKMFYYAGYTECPLCNENATLKKTAPTITKVAPRVTGSKAPEITIIFKANDCAFVIDANAYMNSSNEVVDIRHGTKIKVNSRTEIQFSNDGEVVYCVDASSITLRDRLGKELSVINRAYKSNYLIKDRTIYYVNASDNLIEMTVTPKGNLVHCLTTAYNPIFEVDDGKYCVISRHPGKILIQTPEYTFDKIECTQKINEYCIKYDRRTNSWLFIYQMKNGRHRTLIFCEREVVYDSDFIKYTAQTLSNIAFFNRTIYAPSDSKIVGINTIKGKAVDIPCDVVDESSKLEFTGKGFKIYNNDAIYLYE